MTAIAAGDRVLLLEPATGRRYLLHCDGKGTRKAPGLGIVDPDRLVGIPWGTRQQVGAKDVVLLPPTSADHQAVLRRKAQIIVPKDLSRIVYELAIAPGGRVFECGIGSGAATTALAHAVGPRGRIVVQELREDFLQWAMGNLEAAGLADRVEGHLGDLGAGLVPDGPFDAALLDLPEPAAALVHLWPALAVGARVVCYVPQVSQMEAAARAMVSLDAGDVRCMEIIERAWEVKERGSRPSFEGLGHTGFLVLGRRLG